MECSKEKMIEILERLLATPRFQRIAFANAYKIAPRPEFGRNFFSTNRISFVIAGNFLLNVGSGTDYTQKSYPEGTVLVMKPYSLTDQSFLQEGREMFGIVCHSEYLRILYSNNLSDAHPAPDPDYYYHISDSLRPCTINAIAALCALTEGPEADALVAPLMYSICTLILNDLKASNFKSCGRAYDLWERILEYLSTIFPQQKNRGEIARHFKITETYVSRLFTQYAGMRFSDYVRRENLTKAAEMLAESSYSIKEIACACNFCTPSYFIRVFRKAYHSSPSTWRRMQNHQKE